MHSLLSQPIDLVFERDYCEPQCVIMSPTRELAIQIRDNVHKLIQGTIIKLSILYGGTATGHQKSTLAVIIIIFLLKFIDFMCNDLFTEWCSHTCLHTRAFK